MSYSTGHGARGGPSRGAYAPHPDPDANAALWADEARFMAPRCETGAQAAYATAAQDSGWWRGALHGIGALSSIALVVWIGVWGYGQVMRDVSGVPVVRALEGPMRELPERPGGQISQHTGLAVNAVKAGTPNEELAETIRLAPSGPSLAAEDLPPAALMAGPDEAAGAAGAAPGAQTSERGPLPLVDVALQGPAPEADTVAPRAAPAQAAATLDSATDATRPASAPAETETDAEALARALSEGLAPLAAEAQAAQAGPRGEEAEAAGEQPGAQVVPVAGPGVRRSPRPPSRPDRLSQIEAQPGSAAFTSLGAPAETLEETSPVAPGTRLVQLGAFDTVEEARSEWQSLVTRFAPLMEDKSLLVQEAEAGGRAFWRLRARGFDDLAGARRFCAALVAERAECIPVVAR